MAPSRNKDFAPLFHAFGIAVYVAQDLEGGLHSLLKMIDLQLQVNGKTRVRVNLDSPQSHMKFGEILEQVQLFEYLTDAERKMIQKGMKTRNFLVHNFWRREAMDFASPSGRQNILQDLNRCRDECQKARDIVHSLIDRHLAKYGISLDAVGKPIADSWQSDESIQ